MNFQSFIFLFVLQGDDGNQYVVLEVIQLNEAGRTLTNAMANVHGDDNDVDDDDDLDDDDDDDLDDDVGGIVIKKEFDDRPKTSNMKK